MVNPGRDTLISKWGRLRGRKSKIFCMVSGMNREKTEQGARSQETMVRAEKCNSDIWCVGDWSMWADLFEM
jgi:hypothetical protein